MKLARCDCRPPVRSRIHGASASMSTTIRRLVAAAVLAPNAVNQQPWTFTIVRDRHRLDRISREAKAHMLATMPAGAHSGHFHSLLDDPDFDIFYRAPALIVISASAPGPWIVEDCALAAENLMLAAFAEGLGTCWIGFSQSFLNTPNGKAILGVPEAWVPVAPIIVGRPKALADAGSPQGTGNPLGRLIAASVTPTTSGGHAMKSFPYPRSINCSSPDRSSC